jgi:SAM-dependent methyltransferase
MLRRGLADGRTDLRGTALTATMGAVREHYDAVLSQYYSRMFGEFEAKVAEQQALLERVGITLRPNGGLAVDLGCGSGFQSIALARLGFRVLAIDFSPRLLAELSERAHGLPITPLEGDIRDIGTLGPTGVELVVCMGDTLSHLDHEGDLDRVFTGVGTRLAIGGRFVLTFRDLSGPLHDLDRFIPLCSSDDLIMTCFLEYEPSHVRVHDLIWMRQSDGWHFRKGVYSKLRLAPDAVVRRLEKAAFTVERHAASVVMVTLVGTRR